MSMSDYYVLENHKVIPADKMTWERMMKNPETRRVAETIIGEAYVSTVFLSLDHSFGSGPPLLFETMVFGGKFDQEPYLCTTWEEAIAMHETTCERVRSTGAAIGGKDEHR